MANKYHKSQSHAPKFFSIFLDYFYPDLNNCFYQRFKLMETLYSIIGKKEEEKAKKEENDIR